MLRGNGLKFPMGHLDWKLGRIPSQKGQLGIGKTAQGSGRVAISGGIYKMCGYGSVVYM